MYPNLVETSILHVLIMPRSEDIKDQSPFQGYLIDLISSHHSRLLEYMSILPTSANELFISHEELIQHRINLSVSNNFLLDKISFKKWFEVFQAHPFIFCYCVDEESAKYVKDVSKASKYPLLVVGWSDICDIVLGDEFTPFLLDEKISERFNLLKENGDLNEKSKDFLSSRVARTTQLIELDQKSYSHAVSNANEAVLYSLGYSLSGTNVLQGSHERQPYIEAILDTSQKVLSLTNEYKTTSLKSDIVLYCPSIFTHLYNFKDQFWNRIRRDLKNKKSRDFLIDGVFRNNSYSGINMQDFNKEDVKQVFENKVLQMILSTRQSELRLSSAAINMLCTSYCVPAIRLANSLNFFHGNFKDIESLVSSGTDKSKRKLDRKFKDLVEKMRGEIDEPLIDFIVQNSNSITLCSDIHLDWVSLDRIPLMFTHETSKIPTTPGNLFLQNCTNFSNVTVKQNELLNITVIRSFREHDPLKYKLEEALTHYSKLVDDIEITIVDVGSEDEFVSAFNEIKGSILIMDCHGNHGGADSHGWLQIGGDQVDIWHLPIISPPIIILSACLTSALAGSHASVANSFLARGSISVLGTLLPVNAIKSAIFVGRLVYRISAFLKAIQKMRVDVLTWRTFITGFLRMSFCTDFLMLFRDELKWITPEEYTELHTQCSYLINTNHPDWYDESLKLISEVANKPIETVDMTVQDIGLTETMYYSQLGRPESIVIEL